MFTNIRRKRFCESVKLERERESVREGEREREREHVNTPPILARVEIERLSGGKLVREKESNS